MEKTAREQRKAYIDRNFDWVDISTESFRIYQYESGFEIRIDNPVRLAVSKNGHRVEDATRTGHYIPYGWKHLYWGAKEGNPVFVY